MFRNFKSGINSNSRGEGLYLRLAVFIRGRAKVFLSDGITTGMLPPRVPGLISVVCSSLLWPKGNLGSEMSF